MQAADTYWYIYCFLRAFLLYRRCSRWRKLIDMLRNLERKIDRFNAKQDSSNLLMYHIDREIIQRDNFLYSCYSPSETRQHRLDKL